MRQIMANLLNLSLDTLSLFSVQNVLLKANYKQNVTGRKIQYVKLKLAVNIVPTNMKSNSIKCGEYLKKNHLYNTS